MKRSIKTIFALVACFTLGTTAFGMAESARVIDPHEGTYMYAMRNWYSAFSKFYSVSPVRQAMGLVPGAMLGGALGYYYFSKVDSRFEIILDEIAKETKSVSDHGFINYEKVNDLIIQGDSIYPKAATAYWQLFKEAWQKYYRCITKRTFTKNTLDQELAKAHEYVVNNLKPQVLQTKLQKRTSAIKGMLVGSLVNVLGYYLINS